jgi:hypothetical protein
MATTLRILAILQGGLGVTMALLGFWLGIRRWQLMGPVVAAMSLTLWR